jgi:hypothetical protein
MMIFEHGIPGCELDEDPGRLGGKGGKSSEGSKQSKGHHRGSGSPDVSLP